MLSMSLNKSAQLNFLRFFLRTLACGACMLTHFLQLAWSAQDTLVCPAELSAQAFQIIAPSSEWAAFMEHPLNLASVSLMQGEPATQAHLKPSRTVSSKETDMVIWTFEGEYPKGKWLSCRYGDGAVTLSKRIADTYSECTVVYKTNRRSRVVEAITCH
jgi:hypothetical protein